MQPMVLSHFCPSFFLAPCNPFHTSNAIGKTIRHHSIRSHHQLPSVRRAAEPPASTPEYPKLRAFLENELVDTYTNVTLQSSPTDSSASTKRFSATGLVRNISTPLATASCWIPTPARPVRAMMGV